MESRRMSEVAKVVVLNYYKKYAQIYTFLDDRQILIVRSWMREIIARNINLGYNIVVTRMKNNLKTIILGDWLMHNEERSCRDYLD